MSAIERVTVTLPTELIEGIDRLERNRSRSIPEAVEHESADLADAGLGDWTADLPIDEGLVDAAGGTAVRWVGGRGWVKA